MADGTISLLRRLRFTPLGDVLRGRVSGRLDLAAKLQTSALPAPAQQLIRRVVRRTRLWRIEKVAVADELIAHFADGIAAGETAETLVDRFGNERAAAKLIRRAKIRNRSLLWHGWRWLRRGFLTLIAVYVLLGVWFFMGKPSVSSNYTAELNSTLDHVAPGDRAWPQYVAMMKIIDAANGTTDAQQKKWEYIEDSVPGSRHWPEMVDWLHANAGALEQFRLATAKPAMGFVLGRNGSINDMPHCTLVQDDNPPMISVLLPHLNFTRESANVLRSDCRLAVQEKDGVRARRDIEAILNLARQIRADPARFLICNLVALGDRNLALQLIDETLSQSPELLSDQDLVALAHDLSQPTRDDQLITFNFERLFFYDLLQRLFTDDGHGSGRLTPDGARSISSYMAPVGTDEPGTQIGIHTSRNLVAGPAAMVVCASRGQLREKYDELMAIAEAQLARPLRDADWSDYDNRLATLKGSPKQSLVYWPIALLAPSLNRAQLQAERTLGRQEGLTVAVALELYRRRHGQYPASLSELTPQLLPAVPADRITGEPVKFRIIDGKPVIYSVGANRVDDGGTIANGRAGKPAPWLAAEWGRHIPPLAMNGDWVLYPHPQEKYEELDDSPR